MLSCGEAQAPAGEALTPGLEAGRAVLALATPTPEFGWAVLVLALAPAPEVGRAMLAPALARVLGLGTALAVAAVLSGRAARSRSGPGPDPATGLGACRHAGKGVWACSQVKQRPQHEGMWTTV